MVTTFKEGQDSYRVVEAVMMMIITMMITKNGYSRDFNTSRDKKADSGGSDKNVSS